MPTKTKQSELDIQSLSHKVAEILQSDLESMCAKASKNYQIKNGDEIEALKAEVAELTRSQEFISKQYDDIIKLKNEQTEELNELKQKHESLCTDYELLKSNYNELKKTNENQTNKLEELQANSEDLEKKSNQEALKLDAVDQYSRRQNLEFQGVPVKEDEDVIDIVVKVSKVIGVNITKKSRKN